MFFRGGRQSFRRSLYSTAHMRLFLHPLQTDTECLCEEKGWGTRVRGRELLLGADFMASPKLLGTSFFLLVARAFFMTMFLYLFDTQVLVHPSLSWYTQFVSRHFETIFNITFRGLRPIIPAIVKSKLLGTFFRPLIDRLLPLHFFLLFYFKLVEIFTTRQKKRGARA